MRGSYPREINVQNALEYSQSILINCRTEKQNKNKSKKRFVGVTEKYLKTE